MEDEQAFYDKIGVSMSIATAGIGPDYESSGCAGWTYPIEDMRLFGVDNVTHTSQPPGEAYPDEAARAIMEFFPICLFDIDEVPE